MKNIDTLVKDIYSLFDNGKACDKHTTQALGEAVANVVSERLAAYKEVKEPYLRLSMIGKPDRQIYYELKGYPKETLPANAKIKFLYGDILECLLLFLAKEAGHKVEGEQDTIEVNGVKGHRDAVIDGVTVDVKSASPFSFKKFEDSSIIFDDPFGYIAQLSAYDKKGGAFLVIDKQNGNLCLSKVDEDITIDASKRIDELRPMLNKDAPPERCYEEIPEGKPGNMRLGIGCSYCPFKYECWKDCNNGQGLRVFGYSTGVKFMTKIIKEPKVNEYAN